MHYNPKKTIRDAVKDYFAPLMWLWVNRRSIPLRAVYAVRLVLCLMLFWLPVCSSVTRQDWRNAVAYCWHIVRTGDVWTAP